MIVLEKEIKKIKKYFNFSSDLVERRLSLGSTQCALLYLDGMIDVNTIDLGLVEPLLRKTNAVLEDVRALDGIVETSEKLEYFHLRKQALDKVLVGGCLILIDGVDDYAVCSAQGFSSRPISEPPVSSVIKGPREGFTESFKTNITLIRRRFPTESLVFKSFTIGKYSKTHVELCYVKGIANLKVAKEIERKLKKINIDGIVDSSYISKLLEERKYSLFKQTGSTEKPDVLAQKLLDGRIAIIVDGSPTVLTLPFIIIEDFYDSEDFYRRPIRTTVIRVMRLLGVFFAIFLPGMFVAFQSHQYQLLPLKLLVTIINSTTGIPFSPVTEMLIALVLFEVLGEASVRMPRFLGMAMSVVGGIILGETAVNAGILSSLTVLITALSSIGLYAIPDEVGTFSVIRLIFVFVGASLGTYGILISSIVICVYVASLESYGVPYLAPFAPLVPKDLKNSVLKLSMVDIPERTSSLGLKNKTRLRYGK